MKYCYECGTKLMVKECEGEGPIPYCNTCQVFRFPIFSTAISTAVINRQRDKVLLIQQYNIKDFILLAGYVNKGESAEQTLAREVMEEVGLQVDEYKYMRSEYFERTHTLMLNFVSIVNDDKLDVLSAEVDQARWFTLDEAKQVILKNSLAESFLLTIIQQIEAGFI
ncbi:NUDIX domain-containing protein [Paenibacillus sp. 28ISP30-2]|uniref:NAD(+) diphosphatase n=1 Tax=Paenibacillus sp. 23TSA30-6 TaxID=2546104 RepID=UPI001788002E|nr:NUDIX domain-containing protein [Paenibacillus sp. 23TSA30-6]MBE0338387.1 NUDIX domain-containing protein [Paenibacillus sp. 23TSA30-6]MBE0340672.1 NUDIX domain-containing protein [Paenibacillus sp. 28ISP30-2]